ncbi:universal stress protein [Halotalea alkalilenta]|uniref:UspA domain-containing protein n=1 Tax=Halotalea alkalilenta TaxID=376489 RepID=A0A172YFZ9_9GAMM|nr:universal stress protein [Halotalea alkalilenta]ANF58036.1 hypothetical protein A5892_11640 [Halotalea alkalilenta]
MSRKILVAVDLDAPFAIALIEHAQRFAAVMGDRLALLHVVERGGRIAFRGAVAELPTDPATLIEAAEGWRERLNEQLETPIAPGQLRLRGGSINEQIGAEIEEQGFELLILGGESRHTLALFFDGGGTARLARHAPCDVLVVARNKLGIED